MYEKERCPKRQCHRKTSPLGESAVVASSSLIFLMLVLEGGRSGSVEYFPRYSLFS